MDARSLHPRARLDASVDVANDAPTVPSSLDAVVDAVRRSDFRAARELAQRLPEAVQSSREGRYLRARVLLELGDAAGAVPLLHGLDAEIPALRVDIARLEASALARAGRHAEARVAYEALAQHGGGARDRTHAAIEAWHAGDREAATRVMRGWVEHPPAGLDRARAWKLAAEALEAANDRDAAVSAWRRIAVDEPDHGSASDALAALTRLNSALTPDQSLARAAELIERARYTEAHATLTLLSAGRGAFEARRVHLLGRAYYGMRNRYGDAYTSLTSAATNPDNPDRDEDAFLAARSLARADRDDESVRAFDAVAAGRTGRWADEAAFRAAWLEAHHEHVENAVARFQAFLRDRPDASSRQRVEAGWLLGWVLYNARRYPEAAVALERSGETATHHLERGRGRYWAAMARLRAGDTAGAVAGWQRVIADRPLIWYALLAEARLREQNVAITPPAEPPPRRPCPTVELPAKSRWLYALGFDREASAALAADEDRLRRTVPSDRADEALALAYLGVGEARRAFVLSSRHAGDLDQHPDVTTRWVWDAGFPRPHAPLVEAAEDDGGMPRHYLFAIMRQESGFNDRDVSNARAIGLLQMIPPTTRRAAAEIHLDYREELLFDPAYNIRIGGYYIGRLFRQYRGVLPRAIGSFNAGPGAMGRWVRQWGTDETDVFVERIPFDETRNYIKRVVQNLARYRYLYGPRDEGWPLRLSLQGNAPVENIVDY